MDGVRIAQGAGIRGLLGAGMSEVSVNKYSNRFQKGISGNYAGRPRYVSLHALEQLTGCVGAESQARWCIRKNVPYIRNRDRTLLVRSLDLAAALVIDSAALKQA